MTKSETAKELLLSNSCKSCRSFSCGMCASLDNKSIYKIDREKIETYCKYWEAK